MHRPRFIAAATLSVLALVAGACGGSKDSSGGTDTTDAATANLPKCPVDAFKKASGVTTIKVWHSYVGKTQQSLEKIASEYNASQSKVKVEVEVQGNSYAELLKKFQAAIPTKQLPAITIGEDIDTQFMKDSGTVLPATSCLNADAPAKKQVTDILPAVRAAYTIDGVQYPASMNVSTIMLYYNREHFRKAGLDPDKPPTTLDEVKADAEKLKAAGVSSKPFVMKMDPWFLEQWITGAHQTMVNNNNGRTKTADASTLDNPAAKTAMEWLDSMNKEGLLNAVPGTDGQFNHYLAMAVGSSSMLIETSAGITTIDGVLTGTFDPKDLGPNVALPAGLQVSIDLGVAKNPGLTEAGVGQVGGGAWYMTNTGSDAEQSAAWDFIKYFNTTKSQVEWTTEGSYLPILTSAQKDPALQADWTTSQRGKWLAIAYSGIESLDPKFPGALIGPYTEFRNQFRTAIEGVTLNGAAPDDSLKTASAAITDELAKYAKNNF